MSSELAYTVDQLLYIGVAHRATLNTRGRLCYIRLSTLLGLPTEGTDPLHAQLNFGLRAVPRIV